MDFAPPTLNPQGHADSKVIPPLEAVVFSLGADLDVHLVHFGAFGAIWSTLGCPCPLGCLGPGLLRPLTMIHSGQNRPLPLLLSYLIRSRTPA